MLNRPMMAVVLFIALFVAFEVQGAEVKTKVKVHEITKAGKKWSDGGLYEGKKMKFRFEIVADRVILHNTTLYGVLRLSGQGAYEKETDRVILPIRIESYRIFKGKWMDNSRTMTIYIPRSSKKNVPCPVDLERKGVVLPATFKIENIFKSLFPEASGARI